MMRGAAVGPLHRKLEVYVGVALTMLGVVLLQGAMPLEKYGDFGPGPGFLPMLVAVGLTALSVLYLVTSVLRSEIYVDTAFPARAKLLNAVVAVGGVALFALVLPVLGFMAASCLMLLLLFSRGHRWPATAGLALATSLVMFTVFRLLLGIPLPVNQLGF